MYIRKIFHTQFFFYNFLLHCFLFIHLQCLSILSVILSYYLLYKLIMTVCQDVIYIRLVNLL